MACRPSPYSTVRYSGAPPGRILAMIRINLMGQFQTLRANLHIRIFQTTDSENGSQVTSGFTVEEGEAQRRRLTLLRLVRRQNSYSARLLK
eukprot:80786-Hanusia_phi.AAC.1